MLHFARVVQWTAMTTAVACALWFYPSNMDPFNLPKLAVLVVGAAALLGLLAGYIRVWWQDADRWLLLVVGSFVLGITAAAVASDQAAFRTIWGAWARNNGWLSYVALAIVLLSVAVSFRGGQSSWGLFALISVGAVQVLYGTLQTTGNDPIAWNNQYNPIIGTVGNPNFASALLGISGVAMVWAALERRFHGWIRGVAAILAVWSLWLTIRSDSIQGTLAFGAGLAVLLGAWLTLDARSPLLRRLVMPYVGAGLVGTAVGVWGLAGGGPLASLLFSQNLMNRTYYWRAGWRMFQQDPLFGIGLDSFGDWYRVLRLPEQVEATGAITTSNAAHSVVFQMLGTGGLAFFGTYLVLQVFAVVSGIRAWRSLTEHRLLVGAIFGAWLAFLLQSLFSIDQLGLTVWGWVLSGLLIGVSKQPLKAPPLPKLRGRVQRAPVQVGTSAALTAAIALSLGGLALVADPFTTDGRVRDVVGVTVDNGQPVQVQELVNLLESTAADAPDPYWQAQLVSKLYSVGRVDDGIRMAQTAVAHYPMDVTLWNMIAAALEQTGRPSEAVAARSRTVQLDPLNEEYRTLLAQDESPTAT